MTKVFETIGALVILPVMWVSGVITFTALCVGATARTIWKVWA